MDLTEPLAEPLLQDALQDAFRVERPGPAAAQPVRPAADALHPSRAARGPGSAFFSQSRALFADQWPGRPASLLCLAAALVASLGLARLVQAADGFVDLSSALDLDSLVTPWFDTVSRQRFTQTLAGGLRRILVDGDREVLSLAVRGRLETDFARPVAPDSNDPREAEPVDWVLQQAQLDYRPEVGWLARGGRQLLLGPLSARDVDGGLVQLPLLSGTWLRLAGGREVRPELAGPDGDLFDAAGPRFQAFGDPRLDPTWLGQLEAGGAAGPLDLGLGHRLSWRHGDRVGQQTGWLARLALPAVTARLRGSFDHLMERPDRLDAQVQVPLAGDLASLWVGWREVAPAFDGDSIFLVFASSPWVEWRLGGELTPGPDVRWGLQLQGRLRAFARDGDIPWDGGLAGGTTSPGASLSAWGTPWSRLDLRATVSVDGGEGGLELGSQLGARCWALPPDLEVGLLLSHVYRESDVWADRFGHQLAARAYASLALTSFGRAGAWVDYLADYRFGRSIQAMALVEFDLGPL